MVGCKTNSSYILRVLHSNEVKLYLKVTQNSRKVHNEDNTIHQWILFLAQLKHLLSKSLIIAQTAEPNRTEPRCMVGIQAVLQVSAGKQKCPNYGCGGSSAQTLGLYKESMSRICSSGGDYVAAGM